MKMMMIEIEIEMMLIYDMYIYITYVICVYCVCRSEMVQIDKKNTLSIINVLVLVHT